jgi:hypothetical protein
MPNIAKLPEVANQHTAKEVVAYNISQKDIINPESKTPFYVLEVGFLPDISTILHATNATEVDVISPGSAYPYRWIRTPTGGTHMAFPMEVYRVEKRTLIGAHLKTYLQNGSLDEQLAASFMEINSRVDSVFRHHLQDNLEATLNLYRAMTQNRFAESYWDHSFLNDWGIELCLATELKKMNIPFDAIFVYINGNVTEIDFDWAYPGEKEKKRRIRYFGTESYSMEKGGTMGCYFQRSRLPDRELLDAAAFQLLQYKVYPETIALTRSFRTPNPDPITSFINEGRNHFLLREDPRQDGMELNAKILDPKYLRVLSEYDQTALGISFTLFKSSD